MEKRKIVTHRPTNLLLPHPGTREPKGIAFDEARPSSNKNTWFGAITRSRSLPERKGVRGRPFDCHSSPGSGGRPTCYVEAGVGGRSIPPRETDREREGEREGGEASVVVVVPTRLSLAFHQFRAWTEYHWLSSAFSLYRPLFPFLRAASPLSSSSCSLSVSLDATPRWKARTSALHS